MTFQQKNTLVTLINFCLIAAYFLYRVATMVYTGSFQFEAVIDLWIVICIWAVAGTIVGVIATQIVGRIRKREISDEEFEARNFVDERDTEIDQRGTFLTYKITSIGSFLAMVTFAFGYQALFMFVFLVCAGLGGQILGDIYRLRLYANN